MNINYDKKFINLALNLSKQNIGLTSPNPSVGCVIVKNNIIISTGITSPSGRPHAEHVAINKAGPNSIGATIYITLEPCSHFGETSPCADLIINSKITRVVIATIDPDKRVNGQGVEKLKQAGIEVLVGVLEKEAQEVNCGFFTARKTGLPYVTLKLATSEDEKIADKNYHSKWITNDKSRQYGHYLRAKNDAILIGANTARHDNPILDCRILGLEDHSPKRIIVSNKLDLETNITLIRTAQQIPTYIATSKKHQNNCQKFTDLGVKMIFCEEEDEQLNFKDLLKKLCGLGINNLLVEGGQMVATKLIKNNLVDKLVWAKSPRIIGEDGISALKIARLKSINNIRNSKLGFELIEIKKFSDNIITIYKKSQ